MLRRLGLRCAPSVPSSAPRRLLVAVDGTAVSPRQLDALGPSLADCGAVANTFVYAPRSACPTEWRQRAALEAVVEGTGVELRVVDDVPPWMQMRADVEWWLWPRTGRAPASSEDEAGNTTADGLDARTLHRRATGVAFVVPAEHQAAFAEELRRIDAHAAGFLFDPTRLRQRPLDA